MRRLDISNTLGQQMSTVTPMLSAMLLATATNAVPLEMQVALSKFGKVVATTTYP
jgi:hypothetical protein